MGHVRQWWMELYTHKAGLQRSRHLIITCNIYCRVDVYIRIRMYIYMYVACWVLMLERWAVAHNSLTYENYLSTHIAHSHSNIAVITESQFISRWWLGTRAHGIAATQRNPSRCVFDEDMHMQQLECPLTIHHWWQSQNVRYVHLLMHSANGYVHTMYSTAWLLDVQCTLWCLVSPQSECVGWYKWTPATTAVHNLPNAWCVTYSVEYQSWIWYKEKVMHMYTAGCGEGEPNCPPTHMSVTEVVDS